MDDIATISLLANDSLSLQDRITIHLAKIGKQSKPRDIRVQAEELGDKKTAKCNISDVLSKTKGLAVSNSEGWFLTDKGKSRARELGYGIKSGLVTDTALSLKKTISNVSDPRRRVFLQEALSCFDRGLNRPAVVFSWVGAVWILQNWTIEKHLKGFNSAGSKRYGAGNYPFKPLKNIEDFGRIKESDFIQLLEDISIIGKSLKKKLLQQLDLRNASGHPNTMIVDDHTTAAHVNFLVENVYRKF